MHPKTEILTQEWSFARQANRSVPVGNMLSAFMFTQKQEALSEGIATQMPVPNCGIVVECRHA